MHSFHFSNRKHLLSGVAVAAMVAFSGSASLAGKLNFINPPGVASVSGIWDGFYVGGHVGAGSANFTMSDLHDGYESIDTNPSGVIGGVQAGYNWQMDTFVLGLEADVSTANWSETKPFASRSAEHNVDMLGSIRARIGLPMDQKLFYVTGGLAYTDATFAAVSPGGTLNTGRHGKTGGVIGLGAEFMMPDQKTSVRVEGLDYRFNDTNTFAGSDSPSGSSKFTDALVFRIGVNFKFSDRRLKRDISLLSRLDNGLGIYRYRYLWSDQVYVGVMAQEALKVRPDAVVCDRDGYLRVDYGRLGLQLMTWQEWVSAQSDARAA
jgi:opacity protein-like surface antigen